MFQYLVLANAFLLTPPGSIGRTPPCWSSRSIPSTVRLTAGHGGDDIDIVSGTTSITVSPERGLKEALSSLYSNQDLLEVMQVHFDYQSQIEEESSSSSSAAGTQVIASLHDLIEQTLRQPLAEKKKDCIPPILLEKARNIRAISVDVDGTLVSSSTMKMHPLTRVAVTRAIQDPNCLFFPATGRSRKGAMYALGPELEELLIQNHVPGVYLQGLYCTDGHGNVLLESKLSKEATAAAEELAKFYGVSIVGFDGDDLYTPELTPIVKHLSHHCGEPMPKLLAAALLSDHGPGMHKLLLMDENVKKLETLRPILERLGETHGASVTQALSTMLEWIPAGKSKADGVAAVCSTLNVNPENELLALGDAENDVQMLKMAAIGLAMGNASPLAKEAADYVMHHNCEDGAAGYAMDLFFFSR